MCQKKNRRWLLIKMIDGRWFGGYLCDDANEITIANWTHLWVVLENGEIASQFYPPGSFASLTETDEETARKYPLKIPGVFPAPLSDRVEK